MSLRVLFGVVCPKKDNMPKSQFKAKHMGEKSESQYKQCVPPCVRSLCAGDTHSLCVVCLGARQAEAALEGGLIGDERVSISILTCQIR